MSKTPNTQTLDESRQTFGPPRFRTHLAGGCFLVPTIHVNGRGVANGFCICIEMKNEDKKIQTLQLLIRLLPDENFHLLRSLLSLLHSAAHSAGNLMTAESLGTIFAPHLLVPKRVIFTFVFFTPEHCLCVCNIKVTHPRTN